MRTLSAAALSAIAEQYGSEPITIVEIEWSAGSSTLYSTKKIDIAQGKILDVGTLDLALVDDAIQSASIAITLDDTDGQIKQVLDTIDVHKKKATIYQSYNSLGSSDKFSIVQGQISSPYTWGEGDRQVTFAILSVVETYPVGFSPEEGQLDFVSPSLVGKPWPLAFGNVVHVPAQKAHQIETARLLDTIVVVDPGLYFKRNRNIALMNQESAMLTFWKLVQKGANALARDAEDILNDVIIAIFQMNAIEQQFRIVQLALDVWKNKAQKKPTDKNLRVIVKIQENALANVAQAANAQRAVFEALKEEIRLLEFEYGLKKKAAQEQIDAFNRMRELYADTLEIEQDICNQQRLLKDCARVQDSKDIFTPDEEVDVVIKGLKWRVTFSESPEKMCYVAGPLGEERDLEVQSWAADDEVCAIHEIDGVDMFRLTADPPPNLEGKYLLVRKRGSVYPNIRHIIKVTRQVGQKVYFQLVEWDRNGSGGSPRGLSLSQTIGAITELPFVTGPLGQVIPLVGSLDPNIWMRPEFFYLLGILQQTGPVSREELTMLTQLAFLIPADNLSDDLGFIAPGPRDIFTIIGADVEYIHEAAAIPLQQWFDDYDIPYEEVPEKLGWRADPGASIRRADDVSEIYVANILPSTIKGVFAYRTNDDGERFLAPVPSRYYCKRESANLGTYNVTALVFKRPLTWLPGERWEDDVYVTMNSSVGRNVTDVIEWIVDTYIPDVTVNAASFAAANAAQANYPVDFALFDRPDALAEIQRIAWESRMSVSLQGGELFLTYLSAEPSSVATLDDTDIDVNEALRIEHTRTENLMTEIWATYKRNYLPLEGRQRDDRIILRHNVAKYGMHRRDEFFHIYAFPELVEKSATFWLIRRSNTWKKIALTTHHGFLNLNTLDAITLDLSGDHLGPDTVKCVVEQASWDPKSNSIQLLLHTGIKSGETAQYVHFWPALNDASIEFPTAAEIEKGLAGGVGPGAGVTGTIASC